MKLASVGDPDARYVVAVVCRPAASAERYARTTPSGVRGTRKATIRDTCLRGFGVRGDSVTTGGRVRKTGFASGCKVARAVVVGTTTGRAVSAGWGVCGLSATAVGVGCGEAGDDAVAVAVGEGAAFATRFAGFDDGRMVAEARGLGVRDGRGRGVMGGIGVALGIGVTGGGFIAVCETDPRLPKKCASNPPSSRPAKTTMIMSGMTGRPPPSCCSSSPRRRRGVYRPKEDIGGYSSPNGRRLLEASQKDAV